jgi:subtilisin family serine protease
MNELRAQLAKHELVDAAYVKPGVELPRINDMAAAPEEPPPASPDLSARQIYLNAAPSGIDARWAWTQAGGRGRNIRIIDIEGAWRFTHEDLTQNQGGVVAGTMIAGVDWRNHGTAVLGEFSGDVNSFGIVGIASDAIVSAISHGSIGSAAAINQAATRLRAGDIILLEMHRPGPRFAFAARADQRGYIAVEWWPDDFAAILNATSRGIIVVEAAGNGAENLDDVLYQTPGAGFPAGWRNSFRRTNRDSGAIVVGAGAPPPGTHGRDNGPDRSRLDFSNWGALIDAQGLGPRGHDVRVRRLQGGTNEDLWYTDTFSGTSSASPIITGAIACLQGMAKAKGRPVLTPAQVRNCLRSTGSPQQDAPGVRRASESATVPISGPLQPARSARARSSPRKW